MLPPIKNVVRPPISGNMFRPGGDSLLLGLQAYYRFEETTPYDGTAGEVKDSSGKGNHGVAVNGAVQSAGEVLGKWVDLVAASSQYIDCGTDASITSDLDTFTVAAWVKGPFVDNETLIGFRTGEAFPALVIDNTISRTLLYLGSTNFRRYAMSPVDLDDGEKHLIIFESPGGAQTDINDANFYADNQLQTVVQTDVSGVQTGKTGFFIGHSDVGRYLDNPVDEVAVWNRRLTAEERARIYNGGAGRIL